ncbi:unnamed protein product, partial [Ectocarpus sp. 4 AP-2014]
MNLQQKKKNASAYPFRLWLYLERVAFLRVHVYFYFSTYYLTNKKKLRKPNTLLSVCKSSDEDAALHIYEFMHALHIQMLIDTIPPPPPLTITPACSAGNLEVLRVPALAAGTPNTPLETDTRHNHTLPQLTAVEW